MTRSIRHLSFLCLLVACGESPPSYDVMAVQVGLDRLESIVDGDRRNWILATPDLPGKDSVLCRLQGTALTCATIPGTSLSKEHAPRAHLTDAVAGALPLIAIPTKDGVRYVEPFTWRQAHQVQWVDSSAPAVAYPDGTLAVKSGYPELAIVGSGGLRKIEFANRVLDIHLSRFGVVWNEAIAASRTQRTMSATFDNGQLVEARQIDIGHDWSAACRHGDTFGYLTDRRRKLVMLDISTGKRVTKEVDDDLFYIDCAAGMVAVVDDSAGVLCAASGCTTSTVHFEGRTLTGEQLVLVDGGLLFIAKNMRPSRAFTKRENAASQIFRIGDAQLLQNPSYARVTEGVLVMYMNGGVVLFDHQGTPKQLTLAWQGPPAVAASTD